MAEPRHRTFFIAISAVVVVVVLAVTAVVVYDANHHSSRDSTDSVRAPATIVDGIAAITAATRDVSIDEHMPVLDAARFHAYVAAAMARAALVDKPAGAAFEHKLVGFPALEKAPPHMDPRVAAIVAGATVARGLVTLPLSRQAIAETRDDALATLQPSLRPGRFADALGWGYLVGAATLAWAQRDGTAAAVARPYVAPAGAGRWRPPADTTQAPVAPYWGNTRPFVAPVAQCRVAAPIPFSAAPGSDFAGQAAALVSRSASAGSAPARAAEAWLDPADNGAPLGTRWLAATAQLARERGLSPAAATDLYARVALAQADALLATWSAKYRDDRGRPATAVPDSGVDAHWKPAATPPSSPEYPAETVAESEAAATVLRTATRENNVAVALPDIDGRSALSRAATATLVDRVADAAVLSGSVFPSTVTPSRALGACVAAAVERRLGSAAR